MKAILKKYGSIFRGFYALSAHTTGDKRPDLDTAAMIFTGCQTTNILAMLYFFNLVFGYKQISWLKFVLLAAICTVYVINKRFAEMQVTAVGTAREKRTALVYAIISLTLLVSTMAMLWINSNPT